MKKYVILLFTLCILILLEIVYAETFTSMELMPGLYYRYLRDDGIYVTGTMPTIKDDNFNVYYFLFPGRKLSPGMKTVYYGTDNEYGDLTIEQKKKIALLAHYGYNYTYRTGNIWYAVTQLLIYRVVLNREDIYFWSYEDNYIDSYDNILEKLSNDVIDNYHEIDDLYLDTLYNGNISFNGLDNYNIINCNYDYSFNNGLLNIDNVQKSGLFYIEKNEEYHNGTAIYDYDTGQDLFRRGAIVRNVYVNVTTGIANIFLNDILEQDEEAKFNIVRDGEIVDTFSFSNGEYGISIDLPVGSYVIERVFDYYNESIKEFEIDSEHLVIDVYLNNDKSKSQVLFKAKECQGEICDNLSNAIFDVYDINNNLVMSFQSDERGESIIELEKGWYKIYLRDSNYYEEIDIIDEIVKEKEYIFYREEYIETTDTGNNDRYLIEQLVNVPYTGLEEEKNILFIIGGISFLGAILGIMLHKIKLKA